MIGRSGRMDEVPMIRWSLFQQSADIGPEFLEGVPTDTRDHSQRAAKCGLSRRRGTGRQPRILDQVIDDVAGIAAPGRVQRAVSMLRQKRGLDGVADAGADSAASRPDVARLFPPQ